MCTLYNKPLLIRSNWGRGHPNQAIICISEEKNSPKTQKKPRKQLNENCNNISSADENKQKKITEQPLFKTIKKLY
jgi:hypothetical protein